MQAGGDQAPAASGSTAAVVAPSTAVDKAAVELHLERAQLGAGVAAVMALVLALAALLELFEGWVAAEGCVALAALIGVFYGLLRSGKTLKYAAPSLAAWQIAALY